MTPSKMAQHYSFKKLWKFLDSFKPVCVLRKSTGSNEYCDFLHANNIAMLRKERMHFHFRRKVYMTSALFFQNPPHVFPDT